MRVTTFPNGTRQTSNFKTVTASTTVTENDHGTIYYCNVSDGVMTLPAATAKRKGIYFTFIGTAQGSTGLSIAPVTGDAIVCKTATASVNLVNTAATDVLGDAATVVCTGAGTWHVVALNGIWAKAS